MPLVVNAGFGKDFLLCLAEILKKYIRILSKANPTLNDKPEGSTPAHNRTTLPAHQHFVLMTWKLCSQRV